jgi:hypothetical protein
MARPRILCPALLLACGAPRPPAPAESAPSEIAEPAAPVAPPSEAPPVDPGPIVSVVPPDSTVRVAAYRDGELSLHLLGDDVFVSGSGGLARPDDRGQLVAVEHGLTGQTAPQWRFDYWRVLAFGGRWPDDAWLVTEYVVGRTNSPPHVHRRAGDAWRTLDTRDRLLYWYYEFVVPWHAGQVLGLRTYTTDPEVRLDLGTPKKTHKAMYGQLTATHRGFDVLGETPTPTTMRLDKRLGHVIAVAAAATGEVFALGREDEWLSRHRVQRWGLTGAGAVAGVVDTMPKSALCESLTVRAADEAYITCVILRDDAPPIGLLRRFDGAAWTEEPLPPGVAVQRLSVAPTGDLYALVAPVGASDQTPDELWHRPARGAEWKRIPLPEVRFPAEPDGSAAERTTTLSPTELLARGPDDVWIVARTDLDTRVGQVTTIREVVLRSQPAGVPLRMANDVELDREVRKPDGPR